MTSKVIYNGDLRTEATHLKSGTIIETDAPTDNNGKGERFSPTDLVATALASCMMTIMGIAANAHHINIIGTTCAVEKIMISDPRRIGAIRIQMNFPEGLTFTNKERQILEKAALTCPVHQSLHPDIKKDIYFHWPA
ncbi:MAG TPA: OsmC family protein [Edaphocola sp.]|nr:OsmC family protein [Edaphocola sp.]